MAGARKSLNEIKEVLAKMGIHLGMETPGWPPENIEELIKFFAIFADKTLRDMDFSVTDGEIKSVVETGMDDYLSLLLSKKKVAFDNEMVLDKVTRKSTYYSRIKIDIKQIVSDYFNDKSVLEVFFSIKDAMP